MPQQNWKQAMSQFMICFDKQFDRASNFNKHKFRTPSNADQLSFCTIKRQGTKILRCDHVSAFNFIKRSIFFPLFSCAAYFVAICRTALATGTTSYHHVQITQRKQHIAAHHSWQALVASSCV
jgi:hypothetical protein